MPKPSEEFATLIAQLEAGKISADEFKLQSNELIGAIGEVTIDPVKIERIDAAASMIRKL